ncbi:uncharacterized protein LOC123565971 [Mercenaria mercenaria]|uniref:uncharacterized protein LOC123565971 n=1 Tax=Mercenaria mercenaria TaxID=6596 RepID=UPI00234F525C|nr:uncharacterized protein LOC123565971 [Mercenaria mercenaria]
MGNQQSIGGNFLPSNCVQGRRRSLSNQQVGRYRLLSLGDSETGSMCSNADSTGNTDDDAGSLNSEEESAYEEWLNESAELENAILNDDTERLKKLCEEKKIDINIQLNEKGETALILAVKLSKIEMVKVLLLTAECDKNSLNAHNFSPLDVALVTAFDNRLEPRQTICWQIIECLLQIGAEPNSKDAMMYIIRTALKFCDEEFIYRLILLGKEFSESTILHELVLQKLHRYQPVYIESLDPFFICASEYTIKLLKIANGVKLCDIVNSMIYYLESYWHCRTNKVNTFQKLILYASAAGWDWTETQMVYINRVCPFILGTWCKNQRKYPMSLSHLARKSFRKNVRSSVPNSISGLSYPIPVAIKDYIMLKDVDELLQEEDLKLPEVQL